MVVRVYGTCNGSDIVFSKDPLSDKWATIVPKDTDGRYVIEVYAVDDSGNSTYLATVKMIWDAALLRTSFQIIKIGANWSIDDVESILYGSARSAALKSI